LNFIFIFLWVGVGFGAGSADVAAPPVLECPCLGFLWGHN
jgi:hypothetical protein